MKVAATTPGFSDAADYADRSAQSGLRRLQDSNVFGLESVVRHELGSVWDECRNPNWDGYGALPVSQDALRNAYCLLESLPLGFPAPSIGAEPDGQITLEWHRSTRRTLSISVSAEDELHFAGLFGPSREYGTLPFFGEVPRRMLELIEQVYSA